MTTTFKRPAARNGVSYQTVSQARRMDVRDWFIAVLLGFSLAASVLLAVALFLGAMWLVIAVVKAIGEQVL